MAWDASVERGGYFKEGRFAWLLSARVGADVWLALNIGKPLQKKAQKTGRAGEENGWAAWTGTGRPNIALELSRAAGLDLRGPRSEGMSISVLDLLNIYITRTHTNNAST